MTQEIANRLLAESGLTAGQIGRAVGTSRRSVWNWSFGLPVASRYRERLESLDALVQSLPASTPQARRSLLFDSSNGPSPFRAFMEDTPRPQRIHYSIPVVERFASSE